MKELTLILLDVKGICSNAGTLNCSQKSCPVYIECRKEVKYASSYNDKEKMRVIKVQDIIDNALALNVLTEEEVNSYLFETNL